MMHVVHLLSSLKELKHKAKHQTQEAHIAAAITCWRDQTKEDKKNQAAQVPQEPVMDIQKRSQSLEVNHITAQLEETKRGMKVLLKDQGTSTGDDAQIQFRDVAVVTDSSAEHLAAEDLLKSLRKVEDMLAQVLMSSEKRIKERIEAIGMRVEKALSRAEATESQIRALETTISDNTQVWTDTESLAPHSWTNYVLIIISKSLMQLYCLYRKTVKMLLIPVMAKLNFQQPLVI